jgi:hypothetical protein
MLTYQLDCYSSELIMACCIRDPYSLELKVDKRRFRKAMKQIHRYLVPLKNAIRQNMLDDIRYGEETDYHD